MTRLEAIKKCEIMWRDLAKTGYRLFTQKEAAYLRAGGKSGSTYFCFACDYNNDHREEYCENACILADVWKAEYCLSDYSPYNKWDAAKTVKTRKKYAKIIADGCARLIAESEETGMSSVGTRVTAILDAEDGVVRSFGDGVYAGDFDLPEYAVGCNLGQKNPRIDLDNGKTVWGCESWWGPCDVVRKKFATAKKWETVDIDAYRLASKESEEKYEADNKHFN